MTKEGIFPDRSSGGEERMGLHTSDLEISGIERGNGQFRV